MLTETKCCVSWLQVNFKSVYAYREQLGFFFIGLETNRLRIDGVDLWSHIIYIQ
jgi:hypothetical protein